MLTLRSGWIIAPNAINIYTGMENFTTEQKKRLASCKYYKGEDSCPNEFLMEPFPKYYYWESERMYVLDSPPVGDAWKPWNVSNVENIAEKKRPDVPLRLQFYLLSTLVHLKGSLFYTDMESFNSSYLDFLSRY